MALKKIFMKYKFLPLLLILSGIFIILSCNRKTSANLAEGEMKNDTIYKGVLVKSGICSQKVVEVIGEKEGLRFEESWTDESSNKTYRNVFSVKNICDFPGDIKEGDTISFRKGKEVKQCAVCMAYTPVPETHVEIEVIN